MPIVTTNHNPKNESTYARRRSVWKGDRNQAQEAVEALRQSRAFVVHEYLDRALAILERFNDEWDTIFGATRVMSTSYFGNSTWRAKRGISRKLREATPGALEADLQLIWDDLNSVIERRFKGGDYSKDSLIVFAHGRVGFEFIVSKYGYGEQTRLNHHFYHWQARLMGLENVVNLDDYGEV